MAYDFGQAFAQMFGGAPIEQRTPQQISANKAQVQNIGGLQQEYANAQNDPNYGLADPATRALAENQIVNETMSRTGASGAGQSGYERNAVAGAIANFRIQQAANRQAALNNLRQGMLTASGSMMPQMGSPTASPLQSFAGNLARGAAGAANRSLFGEDDTKKANNDNAAQPGGAPGTTGSDPAQQRGGMNVNSWGLN